VATLLQQLGIEKEFAITGGIAKNVGVVRRLEDEIGVEALPARFDTQIAGGLGGALFAQSLLKKKI
jgi:activator of 2-hydroxyglutaryl-CoA dehydratase